MRASLVVALAVIGGCSAGEPSAVDVVPEQPAPETVPAGNPETLLTIVREVSPQCGQLAGWEARLQELLTIYTERHPDVIAARAEIERLRSEVVSEDVCRAGTGPQVQRLQRAAGPSPTQ